MPPTIHLFYFYYPIYYKYPNISPTQYSGPVQNFLKSWTMVFGLPSLKEFYIAYGNFHYNAINKLLHCICIPILSFSAFTMAKHFLPYFEFSLVGHQITLDLSLTWVIITSLVYLYIDLFSWLHCSMDICGCWAIVIIAITESIRILRAILRWHYCCILLAGLVISLGMASLRGEALHLRVWSCHPWFCCAGTVF